MDRTLRMLGVEYLDLYHMHWPVKDRSFGRKSIEYRDTWNAMTRFLENGKARHIGVCNFSPAQLKDLLNHTAYPPSVHQME
jgi:alcohol dehydrogenase (NADP+)